MGVFQVSGRRRTAVGVVSAVVAGILAGPALAVNAEAAGSRPGSPSGRGRSASPVGQHHVDGYHQMTARVTAARNVAIAVAGKLVNSTGAKPRLPEQFGYSAATPAQIKSELSALLDDDDRVMTVIGTRLRQGRIVGAQVFAPYPEENGEIFYTAAGGQRFTGEQLMARRGSPAGFHQLFFKLTYVT
jgi:hypothetical protein